MTRLAWNKPTEMFYDAGLDRGVLYPKTSLAVPWNGLISVDEKGSDSATMFYMDGRPYYIHQNPKEFSATIKAYTYPDEFSEKMGLVEVTDGMYLDSQIGSSFDISYRTQVGSGVDGSAGFKIHLIYNATVSPGGIGYASISDTVSPSNFEWEINTVPQEVPGHRPTAHLVIDTRHMTPQKVTEIENLLYGVAEAADPIDGGGPTSTFTLFLDGGDMSGTTITIPVVDGGDVTISATVFVDGGTHSTTVFDDSMDGAGVSTSGAPIIIVPTATVDGGNALSFFAVDSGALLMELPPIQSFFEVLQYDNDVIVTDLGNGTYSVEGSNDNVQDFGGGLFRLNNVNAVINSDGTFQLSTTINP
jgi:hypothetical protein